MPVFIFPSFFLFLFLVVLEIKPKVLHILGKSSTTEVYPQLLNSQGT
jgi:hypothetical protein